jgi:hypothetical protein
VDREPINNLTALDNLDGRDLVAGYFAGFSGDGHEPSVEKNADYYHGWVNGMCDKGRMQPSATHKQLIHEWHKREKNK